MFKIEKIQIEVTSASVPFFTYKMENTQYFEFDTSKCGSPYPMVNAMAGLKLIDNNDKKLVMINSTYPVGLIGKIGKNYGYTKEELEDGNVKIVFSYIEGESEKADLTKNSCSG